jgi:hypothetical protein
VKTVALIIAGIGLALAVVIQGLNLFADEPQSRGPHLNDHIPQAAAGWSVADVPLGPNEFLVNQVERILNYDEFVFRQFSRGRDSFSVYVAYWGPGKMPTRLVASHTPDRCWTENGWRCLDMRFKESEIAPGVQLQPADWRLFEPPGGGPAQYVLFWHLVEGKAYDYGERFNAVPHPVKWWKDAVQQALFGSREQYFIRITSDRPFELIRDDPAFIELLEGLGRLGLQPVEA